MGKWKLRRGNTLPRATSLANGQTKTQALMSGFRVHDFSYMPHTPLLRLLEEKINGNVEEWVSNPERTVCQATVKEELGLSDMCSLSSVLTSNL